MTAVTTPEQYGIDQLTSRARMVDLVLLYAHAVDRRRWELLENVFHDDAHWWVSSNGDIRPWREAADLSRDIFNDHLGPTHHLVANLLVSFQDADSALSEAYIIAYHRVRADAPLGGMFGGIGSEYDLIAGGRYIDTWSRRDGEWKIARRRVHSEWRHVQSAADGILSQVPIEARGKWDDTDLSTPVIARFR